MNQKKIVYITPALPVGGAERFLISVSGELIPWTLQQYVISLSEVNTLESEIYPGVQFLAWPRRSRFDLGPVRKLRKLLKEEKPDIVFCINFFSYFIFRISAFGIRKKPRTIISYHSTRHLTKKEHWLHHLYARIVKKNDEIVCVSRRQADYTARTYAIPQKRFNVILNCVDTDYWLPYRDNTQRLKIREELGIPANAPVIILTAAFRPEKNHLGAIRALNLLHTQHQMQAYLLFVGDGVMRPKIEALLEELKLTEYVKMTGLQRKVLPYYQAADLFTLVSKSVETFSIAALEAMSCGLPLILTNVGGAEEMVSPGVNGFLTGEEESEIAMGWLKGIQGNFDRHQIHDYAVKHFRKEIMTQAYKSLMKLP